MNIKQRNHTFDRLATFLLLLIFALFTLMLTALGSSIYKNGVARLNQNYTTRAAVSYVIEKVRQHNELDKIYCSDIDLENESIQTLPALVLEEEINDNTFSTLIYYYDGALRELFIPVDRQPNPSLGTPLAKLSAFSFSYDEQTQLLQICAETNDHQHTAIENGVVFAPVSYK